MTPLCKIEVTPSRVLGFPGGAPWRCCRREPGVRTDKPPKIGTVRFDDVAIEAEPEADDEQRRQRNPAGRVVYLLICAV